MGSLPVSEEKERSGWRREEKGRREGFEEKEGENCGQDVKTRAKINKNIFNKLIKHKVLIV